MNPHFISAAVVLLAVACGGSPPLGRRGPLSAPSSVKAIPTATPVALAAASSPAEPAANLAAPTFHLIDETSQKLELLKIGGQTVAVGGPIFAQLGEGGIEQDERFGKGLPEGFWVPVTGLAGTFPNELWATVVQNNGRTGWGELYRRGRQGWSRAFGDLPQNRVYIGIGNWSGGRVLALEGPTMPFGSELPASFRRVSGSLAPLPVLAKAPTPPGKSDPDDPCRLWKTLLIPQLLAVLPSGDVFTVGQTCDQQAAAVEHWEPAQTKSQVYVFPNSNEWSPLKLLARSARDVVLAVQARGASWLASFDGNTWTSQPLAIDGAVIDADLAADGTLFVVSQAEHREPPNAPGDAPKSTRLSSRLWWRPRGQTKLSELSVPQRPLPEGWPAWSAGVTAVSAWSKDDVWLVVADALFHSRPAPAGPRKIDWAPQQQFAGGLSMPKAASPNCNDVYVMLYGITQATPPGYDFPLTRKALAGHPEFQNVVLAETEENGRRFFGAFVKDFAEGTRLSKLVQASVPGSIPAVLCAQPKRIREIKIDWKTGRAL